MDSRIVKDAIDSIIRNKINDLLNRGIIVANYDELLNRLANLGYTEEDIKPAIVELVQTKQIKTGKTFIGKDEQGRDMYKGWLRDRRALDL